MHKKVFLPHITLLGLSMRDIFQRAKAAGFDGVEIFLFPGIIKKMPRYRELAHDYCLDLRTHQMWTYEGGYKSWQNWLASRWFFPLRMLPRTREECSYVMDIEEDIHEPCVLYAEGVSPFPSPNYMYQTMAQTRGDRLYRISFELFEKTIERYHLPVVFDTEHYLEYAMSGHGIGHVLKEKKRGELLITLVDGWDKLMPYIRELHLNDAGVGDGKLGNYNVFPGTGDIPLKTFCEVVKQSGWGSDPDNPVAVTPELKPRLPIPHSLDTVQKLREKVEDLLA